ncbi:amidohydrolase family protein [Paenibacillus sp. NPDC058071]|uniref:amidohydrolase family protein n=1 Tax=Paenibacillus sp. NPDC058071 TaxID=3346326 RepID=UPI0036DA550C
MKEEKRQKDGNRRRFRLFGLFALLIAAIALYPGWYKDGEGAAPRLASKEEANRPASAAKESEAAAELAVEYDLVIAGGRVIDPETKLDGEGWNVGITGSRIEAVTAKPLKGKRIIQAKGLVVAPGFIDNLSYDPNPLGVWQKIADGVTANIAMHGGTKSPDKWYSYYERNETPVHFGTSFFYTQARNTFNLSRYDNAQPEQVGELVQMAEEALNNGALGISFSLEYVPGITKAEILPLMELAHEYNVPVYFHARYSDMEEPGTNIEAVNELIAYAEQTGAAVHIDHINSTGGTFSMKQSLALIEEARDRGLDITSCVYPYDYWGTYLNSARFDEGWQSRFHITFDDLQIAGTMERLTAETFSRYRSEGKLAVAYAIPEQDVVDALKAPYVMIGSDAILEPGLNNHPRASGTFARTVGLYVRERQVLSLMDAVAKMTLLPAQRLEKQAPALRKKGRLAKGMDADIVLFDYGTIRDRSTVDKPDLTSSGIRHVIIGGQLAMEDGKLNKRVRAGEPIRSRFVRLKEGAGTLQWGEDRTPVVSHNGTPYVDIETLKRHGYSLIAGEGVRSGVYRAVSPSGGDELTSVFGGKASKRKQTTPVQEKNAGEAPALPIGELMLERGHQLEAGETAAQLMSIGNRDFMPLTAFQAFGLEIAETKDGWAVQSK